MAARLNLRLILILIIVFGAIGATVGTALFIKFRFDAERHIVKGDELIGEGDARRAAIQYRRGIAKDRASIEYVLKLRDSISQIVPQTAREAGEFFGEYVNCFSHIATHRPTEIEHHLRNLDVTERIALATDIPQYWERLQQSADAMLLHVAPGTPELDRARLARGRALSVGSRAALITAAEIEEGRRELQGYVEGHPTDPRGWAALVRTHAEEARRLALSDPVAADRALAEAVRFLGEARAAGATGAALDVALVATATAERQRTGSLSVTTPDDVIAACARIADELGRTLAPNADDPGGAWMGPAIDAIDTMRDYGVAADGAVLRLIETLRARDPSSIILAGRAAMHTTLDPGTVADARARAEAALALPCPTVSFEALNWWRMREFAAFRLFETESFAWEFDGSPRPGADGTVPPSLAAVRAARDRYIEVVGEGGIPRMRAYIEAVTAFAGGDWVDAASRFDRMVSAGEADARIRLYGALAVEQLGQLGRAGSMLDEVVRQFPDNPVVLRNALRVRWKMRQTEAARELATKLVAVTRSDAQPEGDPAANEVLREIAREAAGEKLPLVAALDEAQRRAAAEDLAGAESVLVAVLPSLEGREKAGVLERLAMLAADAGDVDRAVERLDEALALLPDSLRLQALREVIAIDDPIEQSERWVAQVEADPARRTGRTLQSLKGLRDRALFTAEMAAASGATESEARERDLAARTLRREDEILGGLDAAAQNEATVLSYRFARAIDEKDWAGARAMLEPIRAANVDAAGGALMEGRLLMAQGDHEGAVRAFARAAEAIPFASGPLRLLAEAYERIGNQTEALRRLEAAYALNPNDLEAARSLVRLAERTGNGMRALEVVRATRRLRPNDDRLREQWLDLEAANGFLGIALRERRARLAAEPDDLAGAVRLVQLLSTRRPDRDSILDDKGEPRFAGQRWTVMRPAEREQAIEEERARWIAEAGRILDTIDGPERSPVARLVIAMLRAGLRLDGGDGEGAERAIADVASAMTTDEERAAQILALADIQWRRGLAGAAVATLRNAEANVLPADPSLRFALANRYGEMQRWDQRIEMLDSIGGGSLDAPISIVLVQTASAQIFPTTTARRALLRSIALTHLQAGRVDDAERRLAEAMAGVAPTREDARLQLDILWARVRDAMAGNDATARTAAESALSRALDDYEAKWPNDTTPLLLRAQRAARRFTLDGDGTALAEAFRLLDRIDQMQAGLRSSALLRYDLKRLSGDAEGAIGELQRVVEAMPSDDDLRALYVNQLVAAGRDRLAIDVIQAAIDLYGARTRAAPWHERLAVLRDRAGDEKGAIAALEAAFAVDPTGDRLGMVCRQILEKDRVQDADHVRIEGLMRQNARLLEEQPTLRLLQARSYLMRREQALRAQALAQVQESFAGQVRLIQAQRAAPVALATWIEAAGRNLEDVPMAEVERIVLQLLGREPDAIALVGLASAWRQRGEEGYGRAIDLYTQVRERKGDGDARIAELALLELGNTYLTAGRFDDAVRIYGEVLAVRPNNAYALNNLAFILADKLGRPSEARPHAIRAASLAPTNASILDTAGWVLFRLGEVDEAIRLLRRSVDAAEEPAQLAHLASALLAQGEVESARGYAELAERTLRAEKDPSKDDEALVQRVLGEVRAKSGGG